MMRACAMRYDFALFYCLRTSLTTRIAAMVIGDFARFGFVTLVRAGGNLSVAHPISDAVLTADVNAAVVWLNHHMVSGNFRMDHSIELARFVKILLEASHARKKFLLHFVPIRLFLFVGHIHR